MTLRVAVDCTAPPTFCWREADSHVVCGTAARGHAVLLSAAPSLATPRLK